jgi:putative ABC transport system permease protein
MLGVVIGVGSVIAMIGIGEGTKRKSIEQLEVMGSNMITVMPNWRRGHSTGGSDNSVLTQDDVDRIRRNVPLVKYITGGAFDRGNQPVKFGNRNRRTTVMGAEPQIAIIRNATKMLAGEWYTMEDEFMMERKAVLGWAVYDELFDGENAIGATIKIRGQNFEVVGVVDYKGGSGWMSPDDQIYAPLKTVQNRLLGKDRLDFIAVQASNAELLKVTQADIENTLAVNRKNASGEELFRVMNQADTLEVVQQQSQLLTLLLAGIGSVSLLVGGIGIMNIMLVSVTERTREIGLRKAIGARKESILIQFLFESVVMCTLGGTIGIIIGLLSMGVVADALQVPRIISTNAIVIAFLFSSAVGVFFGLYPAIRASSLAPIEALRYE